MKKKVFKMLLLIIIIIILLFIMNFLRNYFILNKLKDKIDKLSNLDIFSEVIKTGNDEAKIIRYKNISRIEYNNKDTIMYLNSDTNELIEENIETGEKKYYSNRQSSIKLNLLDLNGDFWEILLKNVITTKNINGKKCYKIKVDSLQQTYYVSVEDGLTMEIQNQDSEISSDYTVSYSYQLDNTNPIDFEELKKNITVEDIVDEENINEY